MFPGQLRAIQQTTVYTIAPKISDLTCNCVNFLIQVSITIATPLTSQATKSARETSQICTFSTDALRKINMSLVVWLRPSNCYTARYGVGMAWEPPSINSDHRAPVFYVNMIFHKILTIVTCPGWDTAVTCHEEEVQFYMANSQPYTSVWSVSVHIFVCVCVCVSV